MDEELLASNVAITTYLSLYVKDIYILSNSKSVLQSTAKYKTNAYSFRGAELRTLLGCLLERK